MDLLPLAQTLIRMTVAFALALPVGWERERGDRSAGLRTFPLVAVAACAYILLASATYDDARAQARVLEGVITGVGFLGGGAILKDVDRVRGTAHFEVPVARGMLLVEEMKKHLPGYAVPRYVREVAGDESKRVLT